MSFLALARREPRTLGFAFLCNLASSPGQTFVVALFLPGIKASFALDDAGVSNLYALATIASAAVLWKLGRWIDRHDLVRYALASSALLLLACVVIAMAGPIIVLAVGMFALRLGGQGLLTHVAATATGRYFTRDRGKALSLSSLGFSVGEAVLPATAVVFVALWGWQATLISLGVLALAVVAAAAALVRGLPDFRMPRPSEPEAFTPGRAPAPRRGGAVDRGYLALTAPLFMAQPLVVTALVFHQAVVADKKGIPIEAFALSFAAFAVAKVATGLLVGPAIDRWGSRGLFAVHLLPLTLAIGALLTPLHAWTVPVYWLLIGITSGLSATLQMSILAESFPAHRLGTARSWFASAAVLASALGPAIYGGLLALGVGMFTVLAGSVVALLAATVLGVLANRRVASEHR